MKEEQNLEFNPTPHLKLVTGGKTGWDDPVWARNIQKGTMFSIRVRTPSAAPENALAMIYICIFNSGKTIVVQDAMIPNKPLTPWDVNRFSSKFELIEIIEEIIGQEVVDDDHSRTHQPEQVESDAKAKQVDPVHEGK